MIDSCGEVSPYTNIGRTIHLRAQMTEKGAYLPQILWNPYEEWLQEVSYYSIDLQQEDGTFQQIATTSDRFDTSFIDTLTDLNSLSDYCYRIRAQKTGFEDNQEHESTSNIACVEAEGFIYVPNAFTPNEDKINDTFKPTGTFIKTFRMEIYNRWGKKVFESDDIRTGWDGKVDGNLGTDDYYIYVISARTVAGKDLFREGKFVLLK
jgi:gliding motility-associated-like protein